MLDGIFADSYARWGGRFSLIVPCYGDIIAPAYWPWLEVYDPDIVYSYITLSPEAILDLHERLNPATYIFHRSIGRTVNDGSDFKPDYEFQPLTSLSTIFRNARYSRSQEPGAPVRILDCHFGQPPSRFLSDNFGTYTKSFGTSVFPPDATKAATLKTIVNSDTVADSRIGSTKALDIISSELEAFDLFINRKISSLSISSIIFSQKLDIRTTRWGRAFNLVVGSSFSDRILHWNARLLLPSWLDTDIFCLRVDAEQLDDYKFLSLLGEFLKYRNQVNGGSGGPPDLVIRSTSIGTARLGEARALIMGTRPWGNVRVEAVQSLDDIVPGGNELESAREVGRFAGSVFRRPDRTRFVWTSPSLRPPLVAPDHLSDAPSQQNFIEGYWASDFDIELNETGPGFGRPNRWVLPRRWRLGGAFKVTRANLPPHETPPSQRRGREGGLTAFVRATVPIDSIEVPSGTNALYYALSEDGRWAQNDHSLGQVNPLQKVRYARPSNEARYLAGVLGLTEGLDNAAQFLLHPFLTDLFKQLGGSPNPPGEKVELTINALKKRTDPTQSTFNLRDENQRRALAHLIVRAAASLKAPKEAVAFSQIKEKWATYRTVFWENHPRPPKDDSGFDWDAHEAESLDRCLIDMRRRRMIFQGHRWICRECHHQNWAELTSIGIELTCSICKTPESTPIQIDWLFKPNEFLIESLRDTSVLSLIWIIDLLRRESKISFYYAGPTIFFYTEEAHDKNQPDAEADLLAVADGKALLCEVKSSWSVVTKADIGKLVELARRLRPDVAVLAVMEGGSNFAAELTCARADLEAVAIEFRLLTWQPDGFLDGPNLRAG